MMGRVVRRAIAVALAVIAFPASSWAGSTEFTVDAHWCSGGPTIYVDGNVSVLVNGFMVAAGALSQGSFSFDYSGNGGPTEVRVTRDGETTVATTEIYVNTPGGSITDEHGWSDGGGGNTGPCTTEFFDVTVSMYF